MERNIKVEVQILPKVEPFITPLEAVDGQPFAVQCNATGKPVPEFSWTKDINSANLATAERYAHNILIKVENIKLLMLFLFSFHVDASKGIMRISQVTHEDYGNYTCRASNTAGFDETKVLLNVLIRPRIYELINVTKEENGEVEIICKASGRPAPEITFRYVIII